MAFRFPLQVLLRLRKSHERKERLRLISLMNQVAQVQHQIEALSRERLEAHEQLARDLAVGMMGAEVQMAGDLAAQRALRRDSLSRLRESLEELRQRQNLVYLQVRRQCEVLERMRARQQSLYRQAELRREQQTVDEIFLISRAAGEAG